MHKGNPVIIFKVVKRMALDFQDLLNEIAELQKNVTVLTTPSKFSKLQRLGFKLQILRVLKKRKFVDNIK